VRTDEVKPIMAMLSGFWPTPLMTPEEVLAWVAELTSRQMGVTTDEAQVVLRQLAEAGIEESKFRPRPGQIVPMVQALRRRRALDRPVAAIEPAEIFTGNYDEIRAQTIADCRASIDAGAASVAARRARRRSKVSSQA
jgi:hypothetical protein